MQEKKPMDEFLDYIIKSDRTRLTEEILFEEFKSEGYYQKYLDNASEPLRVAVGYWNDAQWAKYVYDYCKLQLNIKATFGNKDMENILA